MVRYARYSCLSASVMLLFLIPSLLGSTLPHSTVHIRHFRIKYCLQSSCRPGSSQYPTYPISPWSRRRLVFSVQDTAS
ncbi:hypothetical protein OE88DRAFT_1661314 [Heliocybe sulcata]|uniref:Secreted protein n=1 Tax=Heliocybe sulcata TaxID=5364 RepID=A0A5C3MYH4_9AGAM|nr:hypothetical protein OE88DRAFT_1661314 [Heliocybe sulcata]